MAGRARSMAEGGGIYTLFDLRQARRGAAINSMAFSLVDGENRRRFLDDEEGYMGAFGMTDEQISAVGRRDWGQLIELGANPYMMMKIGATVGVGLYHQGAQQRGESYEQFLATRAVPGAR